MRFAADRSSVRSSSNPVFLIRNRAAGALPPGSWNSSGETRWAASRGRQPTWAISHSAWTAPLGLLSQADPRSSCRSPAVVTGRLLPARERGRYADFQRRRTAHLRPGESPRRARSGGVLLAPLPEQRKCGLDTRGAKSSAPLLLNAPRPLPAGYPAEYRDDIETMRLPGDRSAYHRTGRLSLVRSRLPPRRHGLSRRRRTHPPRFVARFCVMAGTCRGPPRTVHDQGDCLLSALHLCAE